MKILFVSSEVAPFCKTGGLGDVIGALPKELAKQNADVRVILPLYETIGMQWRTRMEKIATLQVQLGWRNQYCGVYTMRENGVRLYFIDNEYYFRRKELYGHYDDGERFAFFSKAVLDVLPALDFFPDILHVNDWECSLVPVYLKLQYRMDARYAKMKSILTIHNIQYQGRYHRDFLGDVCGIDDQWFRNGVMAYDDGICLLKGAIVCADYVTTVSESYAREIQTPDYGHGLDQVLRDNAGKLTGIVNGIDIDAVNPMTDPKLFVNYGPETIDRKWDNKVELMSMLGLRASRTTPLIAIVCRLTEHKGIDLVGTIFEELMNEDVNVVVLGRGEWRYEQMFDQMRRRYPGKLSVNILFSNDLASKIYAGSDMVLVPSRTEPCGLTQMIGMRYGAVPVVRKTGGLGDTVTPCSPDSGTGFVFQDYNAWEMLDVLRKAIRFYQNADVWKALALRGMTGDYSWKKSAQKYMALYERILG